MEIIPVIDFLGGIVVRAQGGLRDQYQPISSILTDSLELDNVVQDLLRFYPFKTIYIADLDAIFHGKYSNKDSFANLAKQYPDVQFWLDAGIRNRADWDKIKKLGNIIPVLGSESLNEIEILKESKLKQCAIMSLDFKNSNFLGQSDLLEDPELWPDTVIIMNLDRVGANDGPDLSLMVALRQRKKDIRWVGAGGVRNRKDLGQLKQAGINSVLVASALHTGNLPASLIAEFNH